MNTARLIATKIEYKAHTIAQACAADVKINTPYVLQEWMYELENMVRLMKIEVEKKLNDQNR